MLPVECALTWPGARGALAGPDAHPLGGVVGSTGRIFSGSQVFLHALQGPACGRSGVGHRPADRQEAPSPTLPWTTVLRGGQPRHHASSACPAPAPGRVPGSLCSPLHSLDGDPSHPHLRAPVSSTALGTEQISLTRLLIWSSTLSREIDNCTNE